MVVAILCSWTIKFTLSQKPFVTWWYLTQSKVACDIYPSFSSHLVYFSRTWIYLEVRCSWGWCEWIHEHRRALLFFHIERYLHLSLAYSSGTRRAMSGMLPSFQCMEICVINAAPCCSTSVQYVCFSGLFSNVLHVVFLLLARGKDVSYQCLGFKAESLLSWLHVWRLDRSSRLNSIVEDCKVSSLLGELFSFNADSWEWF